MCDDPTASHPPTTPGTGLSRRNFLQATAGAAAAAGLLRRFPRLHLRSAARPAAADGTSAYSMAMHVHSSFSEQSGSMDSQLFQAASNAVDVLWWTDHDARMDGIGYRKTVHFTSLTKERGAPGEGGAWLWTRAESGPLASRSEGGIVHSPSSPNDPVAGGSMHVSAKSRTRARAKLGYYADSHPAGLELPRQPHRSVPHRRRPADRRVDATGISSCSSTAPTTRERAGIPPATTRCRTASFLKESGPPVSPTVWMGSSPSRCGRRTSGRTVTITPSDDIAALWPALDHRDFALWELTLECRQPRREVGGYFDYLRFNRTLSGGAFLHQQMEMEAALAPKYPTVVQQQGLEVSRQLPHLNWFGGKVSMPDYGATGSSGYSAFLRDTAVPQIARGRRPGQLQPPLRLRRRAAAAGGGAGLPSDPGGERPSSHRIGARCTRGRPPRGGLHRAGGGRPRPPCGLVGRDVPQCRLPHR